MHSPYTSPYILSVYALYTLYLLSTYSRYTRCVFSIDALYRPSIHSLHSPCMHSIITLCVLSRHSRCALDSLSIRSIYSLHIVSLGCQDWLAGLPGLARWAARTAVLGCHPMPPTPRSPREIQGPALGGRSLGELTDLELRRVWAAGHAKSAVNYRSIAMLAPTANGTSQ